MLDDAVIEFPVSGHERQTQLDSSRQIQRIVNRASEFEREVRCASPDLRQSAFLVRHIQGQLTPA